MSIQAEIEKEYGKEFFKPVDEPYQDGFGLKAILGGLFLGFIMLPGAIYLSLVAGQEGAMQTAGRWVTIILFTEVARRSFTRLTRQETLVIFMLAGGLVAAQGGFWDLLWKQYLVQSYEVENFGILDELVKPENRWIAPPPGSPSMVKRSLLHRDWWLPIFVIAVGQLLGRINSFSLGYALFRLTSDIERLPFPMAPIAAQGVTALAESYEKEESWRWRAFSFTCAIGILFGFVYIVVPTVTGGIMNEPIQLLPIPFIDLSQRVQRVLPAALACVGTNLGAVFHGFVLPFTMVCGVFAASIISSFFLNPVLYKMNILHTWSPGMETITTSMSNGLDFWLSFSIGKSVMVAVLGLVLAFKNLALSRRASSLKPAEDTSGGFDPPVGRGDFAMWKALSAWLISTLLLVLLCHWLVPTFPWWIFAVYGLLWTPMNSYVSARMIGLTGHPIGFPMIREASFILSAKFLNYSGVAVWFAPIPLSDFGGYSQFFKELDLTRTKLTSIIKAQIFTYPMILFCSILFCAFLWKMDAIPSASYPYVAKMWPLDSYHFCLWATGTQTGNSLILDVIRFKHILAGFSVSMLIYGVCMGLRAPTLLFYGIIGGLGAMPHDHIIAFAGALLGRYVFLKRFGQTNWRKYAPVAAAGFTCGLGLAGMISVGFTLISKSVIQLPY